VIFELLAAVTITTLVVRVVVRLEKTVLLDNPRDLGAHIRPEYLSGDCRMVVRRKVIADVVHESA